MSQAKVDKYKASKKNRKAEVAKAKRNKLIAKVVTVVVAAAIVVWIGFSGYRVIKANQPTPEFGVNLTALSEYIGSIETGE